MRCRTMQDGTIVWFGSVGKNDNGTAIFANEQHDSFSDKQEGVATSVSQRLSVIKNELWYAMNYGIPLVDRVKTKTEMDMYIAEIVQGHPDVISISYFESNKEGSRYKCEMTITTKYGNLEMSI